MRTCAISLVAWLAACASVPPPGAGPAGAGSPPSGPQQIPPLTGRPADRAALSPTIVAPAAGAGSGGAATSAAGHGSSGSSAEATNREPADHRESTSDAAPADPVENTLLPAGWSPWTIHRSKKSTLYRLETLEGAPTLRADADSSASGLITRLSIEPRQQPWLSWRWMIDALVPGADNTDRHAEDAPVRVVLAFDGDKSKLPFRDLMFFEQVKLLAGRDMPYATLMYIWENHQPVDSVIRNPNTDRVRKIVVASGPVGVRKWLEFRRNVVEDFRRAYGEEPGRLMAVAILTDTDNTRQKVTAWYGDILLSPR